MKDLRLLVFVTQLGLSVAAPLVGFPLLAAWLQSKFSLGNYVLWAGIALGIFCAIDGFRSTLRILKKMSKKSDETPPPAFNDHE